MYKIGFDVNGNDNGVKAAVKATLTFLRNNKDFKIILVGNKIEIEQLITEKDKNLNLEIIDNPNVPSDTTNLRNSLKENTSMNQILDMLANNEIDACLSSGDSGTYLASATFRVKRLEGISRAAFMPLMPTIIGRKFLLLDVGANLETKSNYLYEWAKIANVYAKVLLNNDFPRISLINIGTEEYKGLETTKEAAKLICADNSLNYQGYIEPRDLMNGFCDVAVIDGYGGNLVLKSLEGAMLSFKNLLKSKIMLKPIRKFGYLLAKGAFVDVAETLDYRNVGAAWVAGINGIVIKSHGGSDEKAYIGALNQIKLALENDILNKVKQELEQKEN
ncbi:phosphate acyltransferase PlsX [Mycoplasmopsis hyopharyngis]|uniref:phosphate acyltransferase PlsX n=1 Tax=Mycoplasmopsis hyopharyngis TaxID=29558 RepID=UPI003872C728